MKTFNREDIISWSNSESAKKYVETEGYFGDSYQELITKVKNNTTSTLWNVFGANDVNDIFEDLHDVRYGLFLPTDKVKDSEKSKKYRPFNDIDEFLQRTKITVGTVIHVEISPKLVEWRSCYHLALLGYTTDTLIFPSPLNEISFQKLFIGVQLIEEDGTLQPFGVEE